MKTMDNILITEEGWHRLQQELSQLRGSQGSMVSEYRGVLEGSDPGESISRYLMSEVASIDRRIAQLDEVLSRAVPVGPAERTPGVVGVGSRVAVRWEDGEEEEYLIVGPPEIGLQNDSISYDSPVGRAVMGKGVGTWVEVTTPAGESRLQIVTVA